MKTQIKKLTMLFFVAATLFTFSSCSKDSSDAPATVADTEWRWINPDDNATGILDVAVGFNGPKLAMLDYTDMSTGIMQPYIMMGTYTYSDGKGTLTLRDDDNYSTVNISFSVSGSELTLKLKGVTYKLTKMQSEN